MKRYIALLMLFAICSTLYAQDKPTQEQERQAEIKKAIKQLKEGDQWEKGKSINTLVELKAKDYAKDIAELLKDKNPEMRYSATKVLGKLGTKEYTEDIAELLKDEWSEVRAVAIQTSGELGAKEYTDNIIALLDGKDVNIRMVAWQVLKKWGVDVEKLNEQKEKGQK